MWKILRSLDVQPQSFSVPNCPAKLAVSLFSVSLVPETLGVDSPGQSCVLAQAAVPSGHLSHGLAESMRVWEEGTLCLALVCLPLALGHTLLGRIVYPFTW